jgi:hypothetical protein
VRLVALEQIPAGSELARDVMSGQVTGPPLMRAGLAITPAIAAHAASSGVRALWVNDALGEGIVTPEPLVAELSAASLRTVSHAYEAARLAFARGGGLEARVLREVSDTADELAGEIWQLVPAIDDATPGDPAGCWHPVHVGSLGLAIGAAHLRSVGWRDYTQTLRFDRLEDRLAILASGLLLHDIGKLALPDAVLRRCGPLRSAERIEFERHPQAGTHLVAPGLVPPLVRTVINSHHERWDGGGYPEGKAGTAIHPFARIAAVADAFHAITTERPYRSAVGRAKAVAMIEAAAGTQFDPDVVAIFSALVLPYPAGHPVTLPDGRSGVVTAVEAADRLRPLVRVPAPGGGFEELIADLSEQFEAGVSAPAARAA